MGCFDLMDAKARFDTYSEARKRSYRGDGGNGNCEFQFRLQNDISGKEQNPIRLTATATLLHGDVTEMMSEHIADASIDLAIADVPYFIRGSPETTATDLYIQRNGMKPLFQRGMGSVRQHRTI